ncbi:molecular chaperone [Pseudomonas oryzihabitans]|uniref:molecular chaperone n=1 Tax=Pseudomonas oryzihabitans TaxID=47885 RepID=UPI0039175B5C
MDSKRPQLMLRVPTPDQRSLTFCDATPAGLKRWLDQLPRAKLGEFARLLYQGLLELNRLMLTAEARLRLLEALRPDVQRVCQLLERHVLNQAIVLDERSRKVANLCQALQNLLAAGYKLIVVEESERGTLLATAIQRALRALLGPLIRAAQLYTPVHDNLWLELHQLYRLAVTTGVHNQKVRDELLPGDGSQTITQAYCAALLFGAARCNQLRQSHIAQLTLHLDDWANLVRLQGPEQNGTLMVVAPQIDAPPRYRSLLRETNLSGLLGLAPQQLVQAIEDYLALAPEQRPRARLPVHGDLSLDLLQHLVGAWGQEADRAFQRMPGQGQVQVCIGMSALHYQLSGGQAFTDTLRQSTPRAPDAFAPKPKEDVWSLAFDADIRTSDALDWNAGAMEEIHYDVLPGDSEAASPAFPIHSVQVVNHSPGGYCLSWGGEVPEQLQAGELLGVKLPEDRNWGPGVVRWVRQVPGSGTQMGVELLAPTARPCGLQLLRKAEQNSQYLRALLLPEIKAIDQAPTLIAPRLPFQEGSKVQINQQGDEQRGMLDRRRSMTVSFSVFEYHLLEQSAPQPSGVPSGGPGVRQEEDFDSLWKSL